MHLQSSMSPLRTDGDVAPFEARRCPGTRPAGPRLQVRGDRDRRSGGMGGHDIDDGPSTAPSWQAPRVARRTRLRP